MVQLPIINFAKLRGRKNKVLKSFFKIEIFKKKLFDIYMFKKIIDLLNVFDLTNFLESQGLVSFVGFFWNYTFWFQFFF